MITQGKIQEEELPKILSFSNIDQMAKAQQVPEQTEPMQELGDVSDDEAKAIKYASIAIILKSLPESKRQKILLNLDKLEASHIMAFMQLEDLEKRVNHAMVDRYLKEFRHNISSIKRTLYSQSANSIMSLKEKFTEIEIKNTLKEERPLVKDYVEYCLTDIPQSYSRIKFSMPVINVISSYIRAKLSAQYS